MSFDAGKAPCPYSLPLFARVDSDQSHGSLPRHGRYRRDVLGFRLSQRGHRRGHRSPRCRRRRTIRRARSCRASRRCSARASRAGDISFFCHGTTVGTNALLEGKGVRTGLLVTEGFRGIYPVGEQARPYGAPIFDVMYDKPALLVPQSRTGEVRERVDFRGDVLRPARRGGAARDRARPRGAEDRVARGLPAVLVPASRARGARARDRRARKCRAAASRCRPRSCRRSASTTG